MDEDELISPGSGPVNATRVLIDGDPDDYEMLDAIQSVLDADSTVDAVEIWSRRGLHGHTSRGTLERVLGTGGPVGNDRPRSIGDGDHASLAGVPKLQAVRALCERCVAGGEYWVAGFDDRNPPRCPRDGMPLARIR